MTKTKHRLKLCLIAIPQEKTARDSSRGLNVFILSPNGNFTASRLTVTAQFGLN